MSYVQYYDQRSGAFQGVILDGTTSIPANSDNRQWREFLDWNSQQRPPLDLSDLPPPPRRRAKTIAALIAEIQALLPTDQRTLTTATIAYLLQREPGFGRSVGVAIDGDEPA